MVYYYCLIRGDACRAYNCSGDRRLNTHWWLSRQLDVHAEPGPNSKETETKSREVIMCA